MNVKKCLKKISLLLLIIGLSACTCTPEIVETLPVLPLPPVFPAVEWLDIPDYYGLTEQDFDYIQDFLDEYDGYKEKIKSIYEI